MKKVSILALLLTLFLIGCNSDDDFSGPAVELIDFEVTLNYEANLGQGTVAGARVIAVDQATGDEFETTTNESGVATFEGLVAGNYNITATKELNATAFEALFNYTPDAETVNFNGNQENVTVSVNVTATTIELVAGRIGDLVIKQIYYAGSDLADGSSFRDQFIEIYNNSNQVVYADGLLIAQIYGKTSTSVRDYTLDNGQYDWSKSITNTIGVGAAANTDYVYSDYIYRIPGTGEENPIQPGESIVIAATAINHKQPLTIDNGDGTTDVYQPNDPSLTVDLSTADFEGHLAEYLTQTGTSSPLATDVQNPGVTDLDIVYFKSGKEMIFHTSGFDSFVIFRDTRDAVEAYPKYIRPGSTSDTNIYVQIPISKVIDGVQLQRNDVSDLIPRQLPTNIDGGYTFNTLGRYTSQSVIRKVKTTVGERKVLVDTNNSIDDFVVLDRAEPRGFAQ